MTQTDLWVRSLDKSHGRNEHTYKKINYVRDRHCKIYKIPPVNMVWPCWKNAKPTNCNSYDGRNKEMRKIK